MEYSIISADKKIGQIQVAYKKNNGVGKFSNYQILIIPKN
jgi:hypothetical protein